VKVAAVIALAMLISVPALAQKKPAAAPRWDREPATVFNVELGAKLDLQIPSCPQADPAGKYPFCLKYATDGGATMGNLPIEFVNMAMIHMDSGIVSGVSLRSAHSDYGLMRGMLVEKYGPPTVRSVETLQNRMGATFSSELLQWLGRSVTITLKERSIQLDESAAFFSHVGAAAKRVDDQRDRAKSGASKL
jgi:hypothetical protein